MGKITLLVQGLIALADVLPLVSVAIDKLADLWVSRKIKGINNAKIDKQDKRRALMNALKEAKSNEDRMAISIMLHDLNKL
jgi:hypothetical protein